MKTARPPRNLACSVPTGVAFTVAVITDDAPLDTTATVIGSGLRTAANLPPVLVLDLAGLVLEVGEANQAIAQLPTKGLVTDRVTTETSTITHKGYFRGVILQMWATTRYVIVCALAISLDEDREVDACRTPGL